MSGGREINKSEGKTRGMETKAGGREGGGGTTSWIDMQRNVGTDLPFVELWSMTTIIEEYAVVGTVERRAETLKLLAASLPGLWDGVGAWVQSHLDCYKDGKMGLLTQRCASGDRHYFEHPEFGTSNR